MTSANTVHYTISDKRGVVAGEITWNFYCKTRWHEFTKFSPPEEFTVQAWGYDEEDDLWEDEPMNLAEFLKTHN